MNVKRLAAGAALALAISAIPVGTASAAQDTTCMRAGIGTLQSAGLLDDVARDGLPISTAQVLGVTVRDGASLDGVPDPLPLHVILADHRAGSDSIFVYPWCSR